MRRYAWMALLLVAACNRMCEPTLQHIVACANACQPNGVSNVTFTGCACNPPKAPGSTP